MTPLGLELEALMRRQNELQAEAATLREVLELDLHLSRHGAVVPVGSAALGLMMWRDLDLTVVCRKLDTAAVARDRCATRRPSPHARGAVHERHRGLEH